MSGFWKSKIEATKPAQYLTTKRKNTEGVHKNIKTQKPFEQRTQKAFLR
jgi:hypothetical protein